MPFDKQKGNQISDNLWDLHSSFTKISLFEGNLKKKNDNSFLFQLAIQYQYWSWKIAISFQCEEPQNMYNIMLKDQDTTHKFGY